MTIQKQTPAESLANKITERLSREGLINADRALRFSQSLAIGKVKEGDWRIEIELTPTGEKTRKENA